METDQPIEENEDVGTQEEVQGPPLDNSEGARLMVTKLVLENFKSYAGVQEIGPFHHCFSAIVGPNGSGKSNVIDAILFVFGKQAKQLRLHRVSELIHNSENHQNLPYAKVSVYFQLVRSNVSHMLPTPTNNA